MRVEYLNGTALDRWVAKAIGCEERADVFILNEPVAGHREHKVADWRPSELWFQGGPLIEQEGIGLFYDGDGWHAESDGGSWHGETLLLAAMRAFVAAAFGEEVEE